MQPSGFTPPLSSTGTTSSSCGPCQPSLAKSLKASGASAFQITPAMPAPPVVIGIFGQGDAPISVTGSDSSERTSSSVRARMADLKAERAREAFLVQQVNCGVGGQSNTTGRLRSLPIRSIEISLCGCTDIHDSGAWFIIANCCGGGKPGIHASGAWHPAANGGYPQAKSRQRIF